MVKNNYFRKLCIRLICLSWILFSFSILSLSCGKIVEPGQKIRFSIKVISGDRQIGTVGEQLNDPIVVQVTDNSNNPVKGADVSF